MTYSKIDLSELELANETLKSSKDLFYDSFIKGGPFADFHNIIPDVKFTKEVGLLGELGIIGTTRQGCSPTADVASATATKKVWTQSSWQVILDFCAADLAATIAKYDLKMGPERNKLEGTAYFEAIMELLGTAINKMLWRIAWMSDTEAAHSDDSPAGVINPNYALKYFTMADGYWKQIYAIVAETPARKIAIAANAEATAALQDSALTSTLAFGYLQNFKYSCSAPLKAEIGAGNTRNFATRSLIDKAEQYLMDKSIVPTYENLTNGVKALRINGMLWEPMDIWDEQIRAYEDNGTTYNKPHRALVTTKDNILFGVPSSSIIDTLDAYYLLKEEVERVKAEDDFSPLILRDNLVQVAY